MKHQRIESWKAAKMAYVAELKRIMAVAEAAMRSIGEECGQIPSGGFVSLGPLPELEFRIVLGSVQSPTCGGWELIDGVEMRHWHWTLGQCLSYVAAMSEMDDVGIEAAVLRLI